MSGSDAAHPEPAVLERDATMTLEMLRVGHTLELPPHLFASGDIDVPAGVRDLQVTVLRQTHREALYRLCGYVLAEQLPPVSVTEQVQVGFPMPVSWWDMFKAAHAGRWWARWWVRRHPARTRRVTRVAGVTVDLTRYRTFPEATVPLPADLGSARAAHTLTARRWVQRR